MKKITIKDIARELGLHHTTVSRALRDQSEVKDKTRELIRNKAREMRYIPNTFAVGLRNNRSKTIGILIPSIQPHFFSSTISAITNLAHGEGYSVMIFQSNENIDLERKNIMAMMEHGVAGVISSLATTTHDITHFEILQRYKIPLVFFDRVPEANQVQKVLIDNFDAGCQATTHLIHQGYKEITFIGSKEPLSVFDDRINGYKKTMHRFGLRENIILEDIHFESGYWRAMKLIKQQPLPQAIIGVVDQLAIGMIKAFNQQHVRIPKDVAITGFDNDPAGEWILPSLTTLAQPIESIAKDTFNNLIQQINQVKTTDDQPHTRLKMKLLIRESTQPNDDYHEK